MGSETSSEQDDPTSVNVQFWDALAAVHGGVVEAAVTAFTELEPTHGSLAPVTNASITEWVHHEPEFGPRAARWQLVRYNDAAHLVGLPTSTRRD